MLEHGGALRAAAKRYAIALPDWLDLSTGINPLSRPLPLPPPTVWQRLPEDDDGLEQTAAEYYGTDELLPVAGSQAAIQALPLLRLSSQVGVLTPGYNEHAHAWRRHSHPTALLEAGAIADALDDLDVMIISNPNNPTGACFEPEELLSWRARLAQRGGWLIVDEAFIDATPQRSLTRYAGLPGLVILRSLGKFFGLAGARVGFALADAALRQRLRDRLGPWTISGPGRWAAAQALADRDWQQTMRERLPRMSARLQALLNRQGLRVSGGTALFQWLLHSNAGWLQDALAQRGIWIRQFADPLSLRLGLPGEESAWQRLEQALTEIREETQ